MKQVAEDNIAPGIVTLGPDKRNKKNPVFNESDKTREERTEKMKNKLHYVGLNPA